MWARRNEQHENVNKDTKRETSPVVIDQDPVKFAWLIDAKPVAYTKLNGWYSPDFLLSAYYITNYSATPSQDSSNSQTKSL